MLSCSSQSSYPVLAPSRNSSRRSGSFLRLGACALLLLPLVASAGQGDKGPFTLRMKFKQGDVLKYQVNMQMVMAIIMPNQPQPMTMPSNSSMVLEQKVDKLLPNGGAEVTMTTKNQQATTNGQPM